MFSIGRGIFRTRLLNTRRRLMAVLYYIRPHKRCAIILRGVRWTVSPCCHYPTRCSDFRRFCVAHINNLYNTTFWALVQEGGETTTEAHQTLKVRGYSRIFDFDFLQSILSAQPFLNGPGWFF